MVLFNIVRNENSNLDVAKQQRGRSKTCNVKGRDGTVGVWDWWNLMRVIGMGAGDVLKA